MFPTNLLIYFETDLLIGQDELHQPYAVILLMIIKPHSHALDGKLEFDVGVVEEFSVVLA